MNPMLIITGAVALGKYLSKVLWDTKPQGVITNSRVDRAIVARFGNVARYVMNPQYNAYSDKQFAKFIATDDTDKEEFTEKHNCVVFALETMARARAILGNCAFGIAFTKNHALNCYVDESGNLRVTDPQDDSESGVLRAEFVII